MALGESGFVNATLTITVPASYTGGGLAGFVSGSSYQFPVRMRTPEFIRQRQNVTDGAYEDAVGGPMAMGFDAEGFFKGTAYPPNVVMIEYLRVTCTTIFVFDAVLLIESFKPVGEIEQGVRYTLRGRAVGSYTVDGQLFNSG